jgi:hypothetical protein
MIPHNPTGPLGTSLAFLQSGEVEWLPTTARGEGGTYWGKHRAEEWGRRNGLAFYVSEADFTLAAILLGVPLARHPHRGVVVGLRLKADTRSDQSYVNGAPHTARTVSRRRRGAAVTSSATGGYPQ